MSTEQETIDRLYRRLDQLRAATRDRLSRVRRTGPSGSPQNRSERDAFASLYDDRLAQLEAVEERLCFGRLDLVNGDVRHIGRIGLADAEHHSILTDWRAPAARAFYSATAAHPDDVVRRRHLVTRGRQVLSLEDEILDLRSLQDGSATSLGHLSGEGALLAAMSAGRTGQMGDIVATIQAEQDAVIRAPLEGALVVQGGPGTGKTAVALHRAAYLLYAHRRQLERSGVLLIGPSTSFLRYIDQVLPSLGETGVVSTTIADLLPGLQTRHEDSAEVAKIKGRAVFARIIRRAIRARQRVPVEDLQVNVEGTTVTIRRSDVEQAIGRARRTGRPHNLARVAFVRDLLGRLADQFSAQLDHPLDTEDRADVIEELRTTRQVRVALNLAWLPLSPERLIEDLFIKPHRLEEAARELSATERRALHRPADHPWTVSDVPLLDEAAELLGEDDQATRAQVKAEARERDADLDYARQVLESSSAGTIVSAEMLASRFASSGSSLTTSERAAADRSWTYGHIVVDEAQELSAMAWRMLTRRCPTQSLTIVGDVAQTGSAAGTNSWPTMLDPILRNWQMSELTINYRTPAVIATTAQGIAREAGLPISTVTSARDVPDALRLEAAAADGVLPAVQAAAASLAPVTLRSDGTGRIAVITAPERVDSVIDYLRGGEVGQFMRVPPGRHNLEAPVVVLDPRASKGLEFDAVILVEPAELPHPADLYVAMTRPTTSLHVVHSKPLPEGFTGQQG